MRKKITKLSLRRLVLQYFILVTPVILLLIILSGSSQSSSFFIPTVEAQGQVLTGVGILGDSNSDEYRADDNRGGAYAATTFNWDELLVRYRGLNFGSWGTRSEPRRTGYSYNWARSGATTRTLITQGQHTGLAGQVAAGQVTLVILQIGGNDFAWYRGFDEISTGYGPIYDGTVCCEQLTTRLNRIVADITNAVDTVMSAGAVNFLLVTVPDQNLNPVIVEMYPDPVKRKRVGDAIAYVNNALAQMAQTRGVVVFDGNAFHTEVLQTRGNGNEGLLVGGEVINMRTQGNEPHNGLLADRIHAGTVVEGLLANGFIDVMNSHFGTTIMPFSDAELLGAAGILPFPSVSPGSCQYDVDGSGKTNALDFGIAVTQGVGVSLLKQLIENWGMCPAS